MVHYNKDYFKVKVPHEKESDSMNRENKKSSQSGKNVDEEKDKTGFSDGKKEGGSEEYVTNE